MVLFSQWFYLTTGPLETTAWPTGGSCSFISGPTLTALSYLVGLSKARSSAYVRARALGVLPMGHVIGPGSLLLKVTR